MNTRSSAMASLSGSLVALGAAVRPLAAAHERVLPVPGVLAPILPAGGLVRGSTVAAEGAAATSLALALTVDATGSGSWVAVAGLPHCGLALAARLGVRLDQLVAIPQLDPTVWAGVVATLVEGFDLVLLGPPPRLRPTDARRLTARLRERGAVLVLVGWPAGRWAEAPDLVIRAEVTGWQELGQGWGHLRARRVEIGVQGRRAALRHRSVSCWLPGDDGRLGPVAPDNLIPLPARRPIVGVGS